MRSTACRTFSCRCRRRPPPSRSRRAAAALARVVGAAAGANFAQIAATYSDAPDALKAETSAGGLPAGCRRCSCKRWSACTQRRERHHAQPHGFHIVKLLEKRGKTAVAGVQQTHVRHILLRARDGCPNPKRASACSHCAAHREGSRFAELARCIPRMRALRRRRSRMVRAGDTCRSSARDESLKDREVSRDPDAVRLAPGAGRLAAFDELSDDRKKYPPAPSDSRAQGRRGLPGLAAPSPATALVREPFRRAVARSAPRWAPPCPVA